MFQFKEFEVEDALCSMKVGTDGVLLGAWADVQYAQRLLDIGTGSGLIALMCAQRSKARITAIDIDAQACKQAKENIRHSPFNDRVEIVEMDIRQFQSEELFDTIISNPPFFTNSLLSPNQQRTFARHTINLSFEDLMKKATNLLCIGGTFHLILPYNLISIIIKISLNESLQLVHQTAVIARKGKQPNRVLLSFQKVRVAYQETLPTVYDEIILYDEGQVRSRAYKELTQDFYIR